MIDCHVHVLPPGLKADVPPSVVGEFTDAARILEQTGADRVLLSPWVKLLGTPGLNEAMAAYDQPVLGSASSAAELRDLMTGPFTGVEVTAADAPGADFWAAAEETGALVFIHPSTRGFAGPDEHYLWNTVGNPVETTVAAAHMVTSGVMDRHPDLKVLLAHGGGAVTTLRGRLRHAARHLVAAPSVDVDASLRRFYYDTVTHDPAVLRALVDFAGHDHVLAGSDHPFDMADPDPAETVRASGVSLTATTAILSGNAEVLLR
ncbi:MAG TPA: amidohydrolase family protein [Solirubrobacter sp.]|nr:amidohydrolase family protein [Solirubrobacter sp.]